MKNVHMMGSGMAAVLRFESRSRLVLAYALPPLVAIFVLLYLRGGVSAIMDTLWTEDGPIFINQAFLLGAKSVITTYQGYLHTFQRLYLLLAIQANLLYLPLILFVGWCSSVFVLSYVVMSRSRLMGLGLPMAIGLVLIIVLQPHGGEVYFSITNIQWTLGLVLALLVCTPIQRPNNYFELGVILIASFTGPFVIFLAPILLLRLILARDFRNQKLTYLFAFSGAIAQFVLMRSSPRLSSLSSLNISFIDLFRAVQRFFEFGSLNNITIAAAYVFWVAAFFALVAVAREKEKWHANLPVFFSILAAGLFFGASLISTAMWQSLLDISPLGGGGRYYFIPYGLLLFATFSAAAGRRPIRVVMVVAMSIVCIGSLKPNVREKLEWTAFANFANAKPDVVIPINPSWEWYPGWNVNRINTVTAKASIKPVQLSMSEFMVHDATYIVSSGLLSLQSTVGQPKILFNKKVVCTNSEFVGVEIRLSREKGGWLQLFWAHTNNFSGSAPFRRFYPSGEVTAQFAMPYADNGLYLRFDPADGPARAEIINVDVYCLPKR
jgi:hypothetical protein